LFFVLLRVEENEKSVRTGKKRRNAGKYEKKERVRKEENEKKERMRRKRE
jgi:hypothetical protein